MICVFLSASADVSDGEPPEGSEICRPPYGTGGCVTDGGSTSASQVAGTQYGNCRNQLVTCGPVPARPALSWQSVCTFCRGEEGLVRSYEDSRGGKSYRVERAWGGSTLRTRPAAGRNCSWPVSIQFLSTKQGRYPQLLGVATVVGEPDTGISPRKLSEPGKSLAST